MGPQFLHVGFGIFTANNSLLCFLGHSRSPFDSKRLLARLLRSTIYSSLIDAIGFRNAFHANSSPDFRQQLLIKASRMLTSVIEKPRVPARRLHSAISGIRSSLWSQEAIFSAEI